MLNVSEFSYPRKGGSLHVREEDEKFSGSWTKIKCSDKCCSGLGVNGSNWLFPALKKGYCWMHSPASRSALLITDINPDRVPKG